MYHDTFASFAGSGVAQARRAALAAASAEAVTAGMVDGEHAAAPDAVDDDMPGGASADIRPHPMAVIDTARLSFEMLRAEAEGDDGRAFVDGVAQLGRDGTPVTWTVHGPSLQAVIDATGVEPADDEARERFAALLGRAAHLLVPAGGRGSNRRTRRGRAQTFIGRVCLKLDELPVGTRIPRWLTSDRVSWPGLAKMLDLPLAELTRCIAARHEVKARLADGRLVLGQPYSEGAGRKKKLAAARKRVVAHLEGRATETPPRPVAIEALGKGAVLMDPILDEAGVKDPDVREAMKCDQKVRGGLARLVAVVGVRCVFDETGDTTPALTFDDLVAAGTGEAEEAFRVRNPGADAGAAVKAGKDEGSFLRRAMRVNDWSGSDDVTCRLTGEGAEAAVARGCSGNLRSDRTYLAAIGRWSRIAAALLASRGTSQTFGERVTSGIRTLRLSAKAYCEREDMPYGTVLRWMQGTAMPTSHQLHLVYRMERDFGLPRGELVGMLGIVRGGRNNTKRKTIRLEDGRTVKLCKYLQYLPADAIDWPEERLRKAVTDADLRHYGAQTVNTVRQRAVMDLSAVEEPVDTSAPIFAEWADLERFKTLMSDGKRYLCPKWEWNSSRTVEKNRNHMRDFARWCARPVARGGLGLAWSQVSFILILNPQVVMKYVFHRVLRFSHLTLDGRELGPMLSGTEFGFLGFVKQLLDADYGWLTQSRHVVKAPEVIDVTFELEEMSALDNVFTVAMPENPEVCTVMDERLVEMIRADWTGRVLNARRMVSSLNGKVQRHYKMIRDPKKLIGPILKHAYPIAVVIRQVKDALARVRPISVCPMQHAKDYRNAVAMLLLCTVVFRSDTLRNLEWRSDGTGHLIRTSTGYDVVVGAERFKNGFCTWLFGPSYRRRDYERALGDWQSLTQILDYYIETCRPILLKGRKSDLLFPTGQSAEKWSHKTFNTMITNWTRTWSVRNERHCTGISGVMPWGPHAIRDIVATHIILHYPTEQRWELAAAVLGTGVQLVRERYAYVDSRRELAKVDSIYDRAFAIGFGEEDLSRLALAA